MADAWGSARQNLQKLGYIPVVPREDYQPQMPMSPEDEAVFGKTPTGLPEGWNYKTSQLGPNNEPLPQGAIGWTPQGEAFYGGESALGNWWNGLIARVKAPIQKPDNVTGWETYWSGVEKTGEALKGAGEKFKEGDYWGWFTGFLGSAATAAGAVAGGIFEGAKDIGQSISGGGQPEGEEPGPVALVGRAVTEFVSGGLAAIQEGAQQIEQIRGGLQSAGESIGMGESFTGAWIKSVAQEEGNAKWPEAMLYSIDPVGITWDILRGAAGLLAGKGEEFGEGYQAGRTLYSQVLDPLLKEDYLRRYRNGENPFLLAQELQNPLAELSGQIFADPLILFGWVTKGFKNAGVIDNATEFIAKGNPEIMAKLGSAASESERMSKLGGVVDDVLKWTDNIKNGVTKFVETGKDATRYGRVALRTSGIRHSIGVTNTTMFMEIVSAIKKARPATYLDDSMEAVRAMWLMASRNANEVTEGLNILSRYGIPTDVIFSRASGEFSVFLREMLPDAKAAKQFMSKLVGGQSDAEMIARIAKAADKGTEQEKLQKATAFFEGLTEQQKATSRADALLSDYAKKLDAFTEKFVPTMSQRIAKGEKVGLSGQAVARFEKAANSAPVRAINNFFGITYMGTSPGYAARNVINNGFTIFTDRGAGTLLDYIKPSGGAEALEELRQISGGFVDEVARMGVGPAGAIEGLEGDKGLLNLFRRLSNQAESKAGAILYRDGVVDTMNKAVKAAFRELAPTVTDKNIDLDFYSRLLMNNHYDVAKASKLYREAQASGFVDLFKSGDWLSPKQVETLKEYGWYDDYIKGMQKIDSGDLAAKQAFHDDFYKNRVEAFAAEAAKEPAQLNTHLADAADHISNMPVRSKAIRDQQKLSNAISDQWWDNAVRESLEIVKKIDGTPGGAGFPATVEQLLQEKPEYYNLFREVVGENIPDIYQGRYNELWDWRVAEWERLSADGLLDAEKGNWRLLAEQLGISPDIAKGITTRKELGDAFWDEYFSFARTHFASGREDYAKLANQFLEDLMAIDERFVNKGTVAYAIDATERARLMDTATAIVKGNMVDESGKIIARTAYGGFGDTPTFVRAHAEGLDGQRVFFEQVRQSLADTHGIRRAVNQSAEEALSAFEAEITARMTKARFVASQVGKAYRDFALHDYALKTNMDTALSLVYPYQFWHTRTWKNWISRIVSDPGIIAAYAKYKNYMSEVNAGLPDWWKYNIQINELLGIKFDKPLFFNLEQTLNPVNGITGVDFNDPYKRVNWWTKTLDDMNKLGPSTWTPLSIITAMSLYMSGEEDAAARWAGRLWPGSAAIESIGALAGMDPFSADPLVSVFSNGIDPYTRRRVGRTLAAMINEGLISEDDAIDAAYSQSGEIWNQAWQRAVSERAPGQLSSFILGAGFKARSASDLTIDEFYGNYNSLWNMQDSLSPSEFSRNMELLRQRYPFMETVLLANKTSDKRDAALAYNVLNRLPPHGNSLTENIGIDPRLQDKFYETKGDWSQWTETEKQRFMAGIIDLKAILATPSDATRQEWVQARNLYNGMKDALKLQFGDSIIDDIYDFYAQYAENKDARPSELVSAALQVRDQMVASDPRLYTYYGGINAISKYYQGLMWDDIEAQMGADFFARRNAGDISSAEQNRYYALLDAWNLRIDEQIRQVGTYLPDTQQPELRPTEPTTQFQRDFLESIQPLRVDEAELIDEIGQTNYSILQDFLQTGRPLNYRLRNDLVDFAEQRGITFAELVNLLRTQPMIIVQ